MDINNFESLLLPHLENGRKIVSFATKCLVPPGENYGSVIGAVEVTLDNEEVLHLVAKMNPPNEMFKKIFNIEIAFKKETNFYRILSPALRDFHSKHNLQNLDCFPKYYGSRFSLDASNEDFFDDDACLLMENAKFQGFSCLERTEGFDLKVTKYLLEMLAHFHAAPVAYKLNDPEGFEKLQKCLTLNFTDREVSSKHAQNSCNMNFKLIAEDSEISSYLPAIKTMIEPQIENYLSMHYMGKEPFNTIVHNDLWINNILLKFDDENNPIASKYVDFQMAVYGNPANDVLFLLHSSVKPEIVLEHFNHLVDFYYDAFLERLKQFKVDVSLFPREAFNEEMKHAAVSIQFYHVLFMLMAVFSDKTKKFEDADIVDADMSQFIAPQYKPQLRALILNYVKQGWL